MQKKEYSPAEAGAILNMGRTSVQRAISDGELSAHKTPRGHVRISAQALEDFQRRRNGSAAVGGSSVLSNRREILENKKLKLQEATVDDELREIRRQQRERAKAKKSERDAREREQEILRQREENERRRIEFETEQAERAKEQRKKQSDFTAKWTGLCIAAISPRPDPWEFRQAERQQIEHARRAVFGMEDLDWLTPPAKETTGQRGDGRNQPPQAGG